MNKLFGSKKKDSEPAINQTTSSQDNANENK